MKDGFFTTQNESYQMTRAVKNSGKFVYKCGWQMTRAVKNSGKIVYKVWVADDTCS